MKNGVLFLIGYWFLISANAQQIGTNDTVLKKLDAVVVFSSPYTAQKQVPVSYSQAGTTAIRLLDYGAEPTLMLQRMPAISYSTDNGTQFGYSGFRLRGIDQSRINISVNGMPLNEPEDAGTYFSNFAGLLSYSSTVQLQRGIGLSKNGAPAFAGSLDFDTKQTFSRTAEIGMDAGSFQTLRLHAATQQGNEKNIFTGKLNILSSDGFKYHAAHQSGSGFFQWQHKTSKTELLYLLLAGNNKNRLSWLGITDSAAKADFRSNGNSEREKGNFSQLLQQLHITRNIKKNQSLHAALFYNYTKGNYGFDLFNFLYIPAAGPLIDYQTQSGYWGLTADYKFSGKNFTINSGIYGSLYRKHHSAVNDPGDIRMYRNYGDKNELSPFAKFIYRKNRVYFFTDLQYRYSLFAYHGNVELKDFRWNFFNPLAGAGYRLNEKFYLYAGIGNIKREPGRNDIFMGNDNLAQDSAGHAVYADLAAEKNFSMETGVRYKKERLEGTFNIYRMRILNAIDLNGQIGPTGLPLHSNVAKAIRAGAELELHYLLSKKLELLQSLAFAPHRIVEAKEKAEPVLTPKWISFTELRFTTSGLSLVLQARYQSKSYIDFGNNFSLPEAFAINLLAKYQYKKFSFSLRLMNLTNEQIYGSGQLNVFGQPIYQMQAPLHGVAGVAVKL